MSFVLVWALPALPAPGVALCRVTYVLCLFKNMFQARSKRQADGVLSFPICYSTVDLSW